MPQALPYVLLMIVAGAAVTFQSPVNAQLARTTGTLESALVSFTVGTTALLLVVALFGRGSVRAAWGLPPWQFVGGLCGALYVSSIVFAAPRIGVTGLLVASLVGQVTAALVVDRNGWFGVPVRAIDAPRVAGVALLFVAMGLIHWRR